MAAEAQEAVARLQGMCCVSQLVGWLVVVVVGAQQGDGTGLKPHRDLHLCSSGGGVLGCASSRTLTGTVASRNNAVSWVTRVIQWAQRHRYHPGGCH